MAQIIREEERIGLEESGARSAWRWLRISIPTDPVEELADNDYDGLKRWLGEARAAISELLPEFVLIPVGLRRAIIMVQGRLVGRVYYNNKKIMIEFREIDMIYVECGGCQA